MATRYCRVLGGFWLILMAVGLFVPTSQVQAQPADSPATAEADPQPTNEEAAESSDSKNSATPVPIESPAKTPTWVRPVLTLVLGISIVLGLIVVAKVNAFIALITAAMVVSLLSPGDISQSISRVATAFGNTAGGIAIVIALAAVIGTCMLDSGAADRIVRAFVGCLGEKRAPIALMGSGYVLAVPVFFDTVFYLLVPLARSLHRRTGKEYLKYILAIAAGGAITHTLVPPTPGPLLMAQTLNVDLGLMIMVGMAVALPAAIVGLIFADIASRIMQTPMRPLSSAPESDPIPDSALPSLVISVLPVLLPVLLISGNTVLSTMANMERAAQIRVEDIQDWSALQAQLRTEPGEESALGRIAARLPETARALIMEGDELSTEDRAAVVTGLNELLQTKTLHAESVFAGIPMDSAVSSLLKQDLGRMPMASRERLNRLLLEGTLNQNEKAVLQSHVWNTPLREAADVSEVFGNANFALLLSTIIALVMLARQRSLSRDQLAKVVETSLMSGGVIILITAGGGAFGAMLQQAQIGGAIEELFGQYLQGAGSGFAYLVMGFLVAAVLKVAQGSSTVAMIVGSSMMMAMLGPGVSLGYHPVYLATAIGGGSLVGSWMNDSGFWIFAKMGGLTEVEALKSWSIMLVFLGLASFGMSILLATVLPLV